MEAAEKRKIIAIMLLVALFVVASIFWSESRRPAGEAVASTPASAEEALEKQKVAVSISGAVAKPGIYKVAPDKRVEDVVALAGGFLPEADSDKVNIARRCYDGLHIQVKEKKVPVPRAPRQRSAAPARESKADDKSIININQANAAELEQLPGIGPALAKRIVDYREKNGLFKTPEDIKQVEGIGEAKYADIKERLSV